MALDILVVDDEQDIRELVAGVLSDEGYDCRTAGDSTSALRMVDERRPSVVLLDVWLHGSPMDGLEVLDAIKALHTRHTSAGACPAWPQSLQERYWAVHPERKPKPKPKKKS